MNKAKSSRGNSHSLVKSVIRNIIRLHWGEKNSTTDIPDKVNHVTVLPLLRSGPAIEFGTINKSKALGNGYRIVRRESLPMLVELQKHYDKDSDLQAALSAKWYLEAQQEITVSKTESPPSFGSDSLELNEKKIDQFLLALNITGKLWRYHRAAMLSWFDNIDLSEFSSVSAIGSLYLGSSSSDIDLRDFRTAASLAAKIANISEENNYPAIKIAFEALDLAVKVGSIPMRFIQNMVAIEALSSTATSEVQHRVGTTCAILLRSRRQDRRTLYDRLLSLYGLRSRVVHGSGEKITVANLKEIEQISRPLLKFVLSNKILPHYSNAKSQKDFLLDTVFK